MNYRHTSYRRLPVIKTKKNVLLERVIKSALYLLNESAGQFSFDFTGLSSSQRSQLIDILPKRGVLVMDPKKGIRMKRPHQNFNLQNTPLDGTEDLLDELYNINNYIRVEKNKLVPIDLSDFYYEIETKSKEKGVVDKRTGEEDYLYIENGRLQKEGLEDAKKQLLKILDKIEPVLMYNVEKKLNDQREIDKFKTNFNTLKITIKNTKYTVQSTRDLRDWENELEALKGIARAITFNRPLVNLAQYEKDTRDKIQDLEAKIAKELEDQPADVQGELTKWQTELKTLETLSKAIASNRQAVNLAKSGKDLEDKIQELEARISVQAGNRSSSALKQLRRWQEELQRFKKYKESVALSRQEKYATIIATNRLFPEIVKHEEDVQNEIRELEAKISAQQRKKAPGVQAQVRAWEEELETLKKNAQEEIISRQFLDLAKQEEYVNRRIEELENDPSASAWKQIEKWRKELERLKQYTEKVTLSRQEKYTAAIASNRQFPELAKHEEDVQNEIEELEAKIFTNRGRRSPAALEQLKVWREELDTLKKSASAVILTRQFFDLARQEDFVREKIEELEVKIANAKDDKPSSMLRITGLLNVWVRDNSKVLGVENLRDLDRDLAIIPSEQEWLGLSKSFLKSAIDKSTFIDKKKDQYNKAASQAKSIKDILLLANQIIISAGGEQIGQSDLYMPAKVEAIPLQFKYAPKKAFEKPLSNKFKKFFETDFRALGGDLKEKARAMLEDVVETAVDFNIFSTDKTEAILAKIRDKDKFTSFLQVIDYAKFLKDEIASLHKEFDDLFGFDFTELTTEEGFYKARAAFVDIVNKSKIEEDTKKKIIDTLDRVPSDERTPGRVFTFMNSVYRKLETIKSSKSEIALDSLLFSPISNFEHVTSLDLSDMVPTLKEVVRREIQASTHPNREALLEELDTEVTTIPDINVFIESLTEEPVGKISSYDVNKIIGEMFYNQIRKIVGSTPNLKSILGFEDDYNRLTDTQKDFIFKSVKNVDDYLQTRLDAKDSTEEPLTEKYFFYQIANRVATALKDQSTRLPGTLQDLKTFYSIFKKDLESKTSLNESTTYTSEEEVFDDIKTGAADVINSYFYKTKKKIGMDTLNQITSDIKKSTTFDALIVAIKEIQTSIGKNAYREVVPQIVARAGTVFNSMEGRGIQFITTKSPNYQSKENIAYKNVIELVEDKCQKLDEIVNVVENLSFYIPGESQQVIDALKTEIFQSVEKLGLNLARERDIAFKAITKSFKTMVEVLINTFTIPYKKVGRFYTSVSSSLLQVLLSQFFNRTASHYEVLEDLSPDRLDFIKSEFKKAKTLEDLSIKINSLFHPSLRTITQIGTGLKEKCLHAGRQVIMASLKPGSVVFVGKIQFEKYYLHSLETLEELNTLTENLSRGGTTGLDYVLFATKGVHQEGGIVNRIEELVLSSNMNPRTRARVMSTLYEVDEDGNKKMKSTNRLMKYLFNMYLKSVGLSVSGR